MELRFTTKHHDDPVEKHAVPQQDLTIDARILLVNDRDSMEELLIGMIEALGGETFTADDAEGAQELIASDEIDVAVVDTTMDDDAGWEIARRLIEYNPEIPVLLIIGSETISIPDDAAGHWILRMPFQIEELRECLEGVFAARSHE
jgi:DNA-binding NtrC family response regulator